MKEAVEAAIAEGITRWQTDHYLVRRAEAIAQVCSLAKRRRELEELSLSAHCWESDACGVLMVPRRAEDMPLMESELAPERERRTVFFREAENKDILQLHPPYILVGMRPDDADVAVAQLIEAIADAADKKERRLSTKYGPTFSASQSWSNTDDLWPSFSSASAFARVLSSHEQPPAGSVTAEEREASVFADPLSTGYAKCAVVFNPEGMHWVT